MTTNIKLKKSSIAGRIPSVGDLDYGELAINYADGKVYYKNSSNEVKAFLDSAGVQALINNLDIGSSGVDSAAVTSLIDSDYVQLHVVGLDYNALVNTPNVLDSNDVAIIAGQVEGLTEASAKVIFDSDYIQLHSTGLDYNLLSNTPASSGLDSDQVVALIPDAAYRGIRKYNYIATAGQSDFSDSDALGEVLAFSHTSNLVVYLNGILLADSDDFTATNNTVSLTAPADADDVLTVHNIQAGGLDSASVLELNSRLGKVGIYENEFTATSGQTDFALTYVPGALLVTLNGIILLNGTDYTATNGNTVVLTEGADSGDTLIVATFAGDSARIDTVVDSDYVQLRAIGLDYNLLSNTPAAADSVAEATNALTLNGQASSYYLDYGNFTNTPNVLDSTNVQSIVTDYGYSTFDSADATGVIEAYGYSTFDSAEAVQLITSYGYSTFDSADASGVIEAYGYSTFDSAEAIQLIATQGYLTDALDSAEAIQLITSYGYSTFDSADATGVIEAYGYSTFDSTSFGTEFDAKSTSDLSEGTNLYYTTARHDSDFDARLSAGTGVTVSSGQVSIGQAVGTADSVTFSGMTIAGDLFVTGTTTEANTVVYTIQDPLLHLADSNEYSDTVDIGFIGHYSDDGGVTARHTGFFRDASNSQYYLFNGLVDAGFDSSLPSNTVDRNGTDFELAALNVSTLSGQYLGFDSDFGLKTVSDLPNDANYLDSSTVLGVIDASYIQSNQTTYDVLDSANVQAIVTDYGYLTDAIDSARITSMLAADSFSIGGTVIGDGKIEIFNATGSTPSYVDLYCEVSNAHYTRIQSAAHSEYSGNVTLTTPTSSGTIALASDVLDSAAIIALIGTQGYLTDALDSGEVLNLIDSDYIQARQTVGGGSGGTDSATVISLITSTVDSDYVQARQSASGGGSGTVDSAYVLSVLSGANQAGASDFLFTADSGQTVFTGLDNNSDSLSFLSTSVQVFLNGILLRQDQDFVDSGNDTITLTEGADSGDELTVFNIISSGAGTDSAAIIQLIDSDYVNARVVIPEAGLDSDAVLAIVATSNRAGVDTFEFIADSADDSVSGGDLNGNTLSYNAGGVVVYINGILLRDQDYTAVNGTSISFDTALDSGDEITVLSIIAGTTLGGTLSNYTYQADSAETVFSGSDIFGNTLEYATDKVQVYLNGILLIDSVDFAANDGSSIVLTSATDSNDYVSIVAGLEGPASTWREVAESSYTAVANSKLIVDTSTGVVTVTLPGSPEFGDEVKIIDGTGNADSNNITINRNGNKILGADSDFTLDVNRVAVDLVYYNTAQGWIISGNS